jgi:DNA transposition AAA+ family ATPase
MTQSDDHKRTIGHSAGERERTMALLNDYMARTGLSRAQFARRINYSERTLGVFFGNKYHHVAGTHANLCQAIADYIERNPIEPPQQVFGELYETENARVIRQTIQELLKYPAAYMIYGPPGSQKSFTLEYEIARLNREEIPLNGSGRRAYYVYATEKMKPTQLMKEIAIACGSSAVGDTPHIARSLRYDFRDRRVLVAIDEAQHMDLSCMETIRVLLDRPPNFSLLLAGMHTLLTKFNRHSAALGQWNDRLIAKLMLPGLSREEAEAIARREMPDLSDRKVEKAIALAERRDAYNDNKTYINIRALTMTLRQAQMMQQRAS